MPVVFVIAIVVVLAVVVLVAAGRGGGMPAAEPTDYAPLELGPVSATDIVLLRPPTALWGYSQQATDEALERIVALEQLVTDLGQEPSSPMPVGSPYGRARHARPDTGPDTVAGYPPGLPAAGMPAAGFGPAGTAPDPMQQATFSPSPYSMGMSAPEQQAMPGDTSATSPLGAPVPGLGEQPDRNVLPWGAGPGSPPEVSHD